jgi:predicted O-methyltransferase YrrM
LGKHLHQAISYLKHLSSSRSAHGVHSPFLFKLYQEAIRRKKQSYPIYPEQIRQKLLKQKKYIRLKGLGAGSAIDDSKIIQIRKHAANSLKGINESQLVYRILKYLNPSSILELGTSFGVSTLYLQAACPSANITTIEGEIEIQKIAKSFF